MFDFSKYKGTCISIVATTCEESLLLRQAMHEAGITWGSGASLLELNYYRKSHEEDGYCIAYLINTFGKVSYEMPKKTSEKLYLGGYVFFKDIMRPNLCDIVNEEEFITLLGGENDA